MRVIPCLNILTWASVQGRQRNVQGLFEFSTIYVDNSVSM